MSDRRDAALILARGESRRMGKPKGLCIADDDPRPLLARVVDLHTAADRPVTVVTSASLVDPYEQTLSGQPISWLILEPGQGTARSVLAGVTALSGRATHLWLHPVDMPNVSAATLALLAEESKMRPEAVVIPEHNGVPGHPVVLPVRPVDGLWPADAPGAMRLLLHEGPCPVVTVACDDPGVVDDMDTPEDLKRPRQQ
jgi:CTP:molybdopterin cytidylyltransferase MocA